MLKNHKIIFIIVTIVIQLLGCKTTTNNLHDNTLDSVRNYFGKYILSDDTVMLVKSYQFLAQDKEFMKDGLTVNNREIVNSVLLHCKKYSELIELIENFTPEDSLSSVNKIVSLNIAMYLENKNQSYANSFIAKNIDLFTKRIEVDPFDSIAYIDYFIFNLYLYDRNTVLNSIDSMKTSNNLFSDFYYEHILRDAIREFPDVLLGK